MSQNATTEKPVKDRISIVIPAYNEEARLPSAIKSIKSFFY